jgi:hypothetical protein
VDVEVDVNPNAGADPAGRAVRKINARGEEV